MKPEMRIFVVLALLGGAPASSVAARRAGGAAEDKKAGQAARDELLEVIEILKNSKSAGGPGGSTSTFGWWAFGPSRYDHLCCRERVRLVRGVAELLDERIDSSLDRGLPATRNDRAERRVDVGHR